VSSSCSAMAARPGDLFGDDTKDIPAATCPLPPSDLIVKSTRSTDCTPKSFFAALPLIYLRLSRCDWHQHWSAATQSDLHAAGRKSSRLAVVAGLRLRVSVPNTCTLSWQVQSRETGILSSFCFFLYYYGIPCFGRRHVNANLFFVVRYVIHTSWSMRAMIFYVANISTIQEPRSPAWSAWRWH
jgi:hypothetical protein